MEAEQRVGILTSVQKYKEQSPPQEVMIASGEPEFHHHHPADSNESVSPSPSPA